MPTPHDWISRIISPRLRERLHTLIQPLRARFLPEPYRSVLPYTMVSVRRLRRLDALAREMDERGIEGDVVECGSCNGGSGAVLANVACRSPLQRHVWLLDSFAGLPTPGNKDGSAAATFTGLCHGTAANVRDVLHKLGIPHDAVTLVPGWFHDTLPTLPVGRIAVLNIDADWYESVLQVLEALYDKVSPGGAVHLDDYGYWEGCRRAWEEFAARRGIGVELLPIDGIGVYFYKPGGA
jgi:O-methyltransferase